MAVQLARRVRNCTRPTPTRSSNTLAIAAHIKKMSIAQEPGTVKADELAWAEPETALRTGSAAIASNAENHTAKRVLEFRRPITRSRIQANRPIDRKSTRLN